jgi:hypothetical protein
MDFYYDIRVAQLLNSFLNKNYFSGSFGGPSKRMAGFFTKSLFFIKNKNFFPQIAIFLDKTSPN